MPNAAEWNCSGEKKSSRKSRIEEICQEGPSQDEGTSTYSHSEKRRNRRDFMLMEWDHGTVLSGIILSSGWEKGVLHCNQFI